MDIESVLVDLAKTVSFLQREMVEKDRRIGLLENQIRRVASGALGGSGAIVGMTSEEVNDISIVGIGNAGGRGNGDGNRNNNAGGGIQSVDCENVIGGAKLYAPIDHQHQGLSTFFSEGKAGSSPNYVGYIGIRDGNCLVITRNPDVDTNGDGIPDNAVTDGSGRDYSTAQDEAERRKREQLGLGPNDIPNAEQQEAIDKTRGAAPTLCDKIFTIGHMYNEWAATKTPGGNCTDNGHPITCGPNIIPANSCDYIHCLKTLKIDCCGHLCDFDEVVLVKPTILVEAGASVACCTDIEVLVPDDIQFDCSVDSDDFKQWRLKLKKKTIKLPEDSWSFASDPSCSSGDVIVVSGISVSAKSGCPCAHEISVSKACVVGGGVTTFSGTLTFVCDVICSGTSLIVKKRIITVSNGRITLEGTCA